MRKKSLIYIGGFILFATFLYHQFGVGDPKISMLSIVLVMALWWVGEVLPLGITGLLPLVLYPILGISSTKEIASIYMNSTVFLYIGGFFVGLAIEKWGLHKRIALSITSAFGTQPKYIILSNMLTTAFLSMWISNTASTVIMLSIALALLKSYEQFFGTESVKKFSIGLLLGIAYSASLGGISTFVGTPTNLVLLRVLELNFPGIDISFFSWVVICLPISISTIFVVWFVLIKVFCKENLTTPKENFFIEEKKKLGVISFEEKRISYVFASMALLWTFRKGINLGFIEIPSLVGFLKNHTWVDDGTIAILATISLFLIPTRDKKSNLLDKKIFKKIPWSTVLLLGGGFALAKGMILSGVSDWLAKDVFSSLEIQSPKVLIGFLTLAMTFFTELTSNVSSSEVVLPVVSTLVQAKNLDPFMFLLPVTLAASCAFILPSATPPNAIIFGSGKIQMKDMIKVGLLLNMVAVTIILLFSFFWIPIVNSFLN